MAALEEPKRVLVAFGRDSANDFYHFSGFHFLPVKLRIGGFLPLNKLRSVLAVLMP